VNSEPEPDLVVQIAVDVAVTLRVQQRYHDPSKRNPDK
jgi:hypothetical protein